MIVAVFVAVSIWAPPAAARRSAATQETIEKCVFLGETPMQENDVWLYDEAFCVTKNPFLWKDSRPIPFDKMHPSMLVSAACELFQDLHAGLDELESETIATWAKVVEPLELLYDGYDRVMGVFELLAAVNQTSEIETAAGQGMALARGFSRRLQQSTALYALLLRIRFQPRVSLDLSDDQVRVLDVWMTKMDEQGVNVARDAAKLAQLNRLSDEEAELMRQFDDNVKRGTAAFHLTLRDGRHLRGVPHSTLAAMAAEAQRRDFKYSMGWATAVSRPSTAARRLGAAPTAEYGPWTVTFDPWIFDSMMAYCPDRRLRQLIHQSFENRAAQAPWDNLPVVERMLQVRHERARLLGSASYAQLSRRRRMASPDKANILLDSILPHVASATLRTLLRVVRFMVDGEAQGKLVWGEQYDASDFETMGAIGEGLAYGRNSEVSPTHRMRFGEPKLIDDVGQFNLPWKNQPAPPLPRVNVAALEWAERAMNNTTLSQLGCASLLANVTTHLRDWDLSFWLHRLASNATEKSAWAEAERFGDYFTLRRVLSGAFGLLHRLWGLHVVKSVQDSPPVWHPDVRHYQLFNGTDLLGSFYFDPFARPNKLSIPFTLNLVKRSEMHAYSSKKIRAPVVVMSTSIKAPKPREPVLLQIHDVLAIFHELGHVIQNLINRTDEVLVAGTTTLPLDFIEMFSQFYELWATQSNTLSKMAQNYKTHALLTADKRKELMHAVRRTCACCARRSLTMLQQLYMARIDLSLHFEYKPNAAKIALARRREIASSTLLVPFSTNNCDFCTLVHSFYAEGSGLYSYLWSAVHASDAMGYFDEVGVSNDTQVRALGNKMAAELLIGGIQSDANAQYEKFRGRPVSAEHFVKHLNN